MLHHACKVVQSGNMLSRCMSELSNVVSYVSATVEENWNASQSESTQSHNVSDISGLRIPEMWLIFRLWAIVTTVTASRGASCSHHC